MKALNTGTFLSSLNHTHATLIPRKKNPKIVAEYRPISLCNVSYKLIAKVLANRLKSILPHIISPSQSVFVLDRLISNNILVAHEVVHFLKLKRSRKTGFMSIKLDTSKAYDRLEWKFLEKTMQNMGLN